MLYSRYLSRFLQRSYSVDRNVLIAADKNKYSSPLFQRLYSSSEKSNPKDDPPITYSTSKAHTHTVNKSLGFDVDVDSRKPIIIGLVAFSVIVYFGYFYDGERNDFFDLKDYGWNRGLPGVIINEEQSDTSQTADTQSSDQEYNKSTES